MSKWNPPKQPCYMLKTVGMVCQLHNLSGIGGVFRNHEVTWILGFIGSITHGDAFNTEYMHFSQVLHLNWSIIFDFWKLT